MTETVYVNVLPNAESITINVKERFTTTNVSGATVTVRNTTRTPNVTGDTYSDTTATSNGSGDVTLSLVPGIYTLIVDSTTFYGPTTATLQVFSGGRYKITEIEYN